MSASLKNPKERQGVLALPYQSRGLNFIILIDYSSMSGLANGKKAYVNFLEHVEHKKALEYFHITIEKAPKVIENYEQGYVLTIKNGGYCD